MIITTGQKYLKSAAIIAAMMSSTSAFAQWAGAWEVNGGNARLSQYGDYISGQIGRQGVIRGLLSRDRKIMRGVYSKSGRKYTVQFTLTESNAFRGRVVNIRGGYPASTTDIRWTGKLKQKRQTSNANPSFRQSFLSQQNSRITSWINRVSGMRVPVARASTPNTASTSTTQPKPAADTGVQGVWDITIKGTEYGPFRDRGQAFEFSAPNRNGVVTGTSVGRNNVIFIGRAQNGSNRKLHGIWMEAKRGRATGRWGLMEVRTSGETARSMQAFFSVGYRKPQKAWTGRVPGQVGMEGTGKKLHSNKGRLPSVAAAQAQWRTLLNRKSPYPGIHGIWPTSQIDAAIQPWIRGEKAPARFGGNRLVDPCVAKCMGKEPLEVIIRATHVSGYEFGERNTEYAGQADVGIVYEAEGRKRYAISQRVKRVFERPRSNPVNDHIKREFKFGVEPPPPTAAAYQLACNISGNYQTYGNVVFPINAAQWSDPLTKITGIYGGRMAELGIGGRNQNVLDKLYRPNGFVAVKQEWNEIMVHDWTRQAIADGKFKPSDPCISTRISFNSSSGKDALASISLLVGLR